MIITYIDTLTKHHHHITVIFSRVIGGAAAQRVHLRGNGKSTS